MNAGNYEKIMVGTTRYHTTPKRVLHYDDIEIFDKFTCKVTDYATFLAWLDDFDSEQAAQLGVTDGKWKLLFAIVRGFADCAGINFCIYENRNGLLFDVTQHSVSVAGTPDASIIDHTKESDEQVLFRLRTERDQITLKIKHLVEKRKEVQARINLLLSEFYEDVDAVTLTLPLKQPV